MGKSKMFLVLHEFVYATKSIYKGLTSWPRGLATILVMKEFIELCGLPNVQGVIDETHMSIVKLQGGFVNDYYNHKRGGYGIVAQDMVDYNKKFINLFVGLLGSVNDAWVLCKSFVYENVPFHGLFELHKRSQNGFSPYLWVIRDIL
jgi:hypothetical protein